MESIDRLRRYVECHDKITGLTATCINHLIDSIEKEVDDMWHALTIDAKPMTDENMAESGWVRLPVDAEGEYIRIGDEMEGVDKYDSLKKVMGRVITVSFESDGIVDVAIQAWNSDGKSWHRAYLDPYASVYRHHHAPTVEDVLREFADIVRKERVELATISEDTIAEFAAKLRLAGDE